MKLFTAPPGREHTSVQLCSVLNISADRVFLRGTQAVVKLKGEGSKVGFKKGTEWFVSAYVKVPACAGLNVANQRVDRRTGGGRGRPVQPSA